MIPIRVYRSARLSTSDEQTAVMETLTTYLLQPVGRKPLSPLVIFEQDGYPYCR